MKKVIASFLDLVLPITDHYLITEHLCNSLSYVLHFEWFKMLWKHNLKL
jgi:hypothetical protein